MPHSTSNVNAHLAILQKNPPDKDISMAEIPDNTSATAGAFKEDPLAEYNNQINERILGPTTTIRDKHVTDPKHIAHLILKAIILFSRGKSDGYRAGVAVRE
ncbi:hypothetical protein M378DRAFT_159068 [Amanita muscaria Koide BX008]|uniref:Uncharacterized protein n=1 Tax=Amanita muscaria (strain Koide BX008) TaxID=946122 RepID=A0A0C2XEK4_AMAMK|nr:hypothetical protein M378DRAFT_159068 [Amanita muscaria Koide BX008]